MGHTLENTTISSRRVARMFAQNGKLIHGLRIILAILSLTICIGLFGLHKGFQMGSSYKDQGHIEQNIVFAAHGEETYNFFAIRYAYSSIFLIGFFALAIFLKFTSFKRSTNFLMTIPLLCSAYIIWDIISMKSERSHTLFWTENFDMVLRESFKFDYCLIVLLVLTFLLQFIFAVTSHKTTTQYDSTFYL